MENLEIVIPQALRAPAAPYAEVPQRWEIQDEDETRLNVLVAADPATRQRAYRLAWRIYESAGYAPPDTGGTLVTPYDALKQTFTLLVEDEQHRDVATLTLNFDSIHGLPCDEMYIEELFGCRLSARRLVEVSRLALDHEMQRHTRPLLKCIFNLIVVYARDVRRSTDMVITVNPRHVEYYRRLLCFEPIGEERPCPRVQGAPAVLMRMDLSVPRRAREEFIAGPHSTFGRTLFAHFCPPSEEARMARFMTGRYKPMSQAEAARFNIQAPDFA